MQFFFATTLFLSATLLFVIQPMFAKMVLPRLGGSPAVWNTCMVFYQAMLLIGYLYAHITTRWLGARRQAILHLVVLCLPWLVLPIIASESWIPPTEENPVSWLLILLTGSVGLPLFVVSASAPMLQTWFSETTHRSARDPYFLYAASNLGSMCALLGYPLIVEPNLALGSQSWFWALGYGLMATFTLGCAILLWRSRSGVGHEVLNTTPESETPNGISEAKPTRSGRFWWLVLSFVPSSLLLGVTTHLSTDVAAVPLLWVIPLAVYLLTFVLVFAKRTILPHRWMLRVQPFLVILLVVLFFQRLGTSVWLTMLLHLVTFFVTAMVCHGELARRRPSTRYLTEFYIWMSVGGVLGGLFNAILAPSLFSTVLEYPLVIALGCMLRPWGREVRSSIRVRWLDVAFPTATVCGFLGLILVIKAVGIVLTVGLAVTILLLAGIIAFSAQDRPLRFGLQVAVILFLGYHSSMQETQILHVERNFFGVVRVKYDSDRDSHVMIHGSTNHGMQSLDPTRRNLPMTYYHRTGPLGRVLALSDDRSARRKIGVIGLGTGTIASYGRPGEQITYFEIDPAVERLARDPRFFTFLEDSPADVDVVLGDARLSLERVADRKFDLLVLDAFSSDAIPVHLMTREALDLYFDKLTETGILVAHISNRYLNLAPVLARLAAETGAVCRICSDPNPSESEQNEGKLSSRWMIMTRRIDDTPELWEDPKWQTVPVDPNVPLWRDDFSNILSVLYGN